MCHLCDYRNAIEKNLKMHIDVKHTDQMFYCDQCDFKSPYLGSSKTHARVHDESCWFQCELCSYKCAAKGNMNTHIEGKHKDIFDSESNLIAVE